MLTIAWEVAGSPPILVAAPVSRFSVNRPNPVRFDGLTVKFKASDVPLVPYHAVGRFPASGSLRTLQFIVRG